jgi:glutamate racemase
MNAPIGIFDSGIGGLTVAHAIAQLLPNEQIIYFGDTAHLPYGDKSADAIQHYSAKITDFLLQRNCKIIVIACNTASSVAFRMLKNYLADKTPIINVIEPVVRAVVNSHFKHVGVIATKRTIQTNIYPATLNYLQPDLQISALATHAFVTLIEENVHKNKKVLDALIEHYLSNPDFDNIEALILGCTHYPIIKHDIERFFEQHRSNAKAPKIFDSIETVALRVKEVLTERNLLNTEILNTPPIHHFYVSDYTQAFEQTTETFFGQKIRLEHFPIWEMPILDN